MKITSTTIFKTNDLLITENSMESEWVVFRTIPTVGNEIKIRFSNGVIGDFKVTKRLFFNSGKALNICNKDPWHLKLALKAKDKKCSNKLVYMDCKIDFHEYAYEKEWEKLHHVVIVYKSNKIKHMLSKKSNLIPLGTFKQPHFLLTT